MGTSNPSLKGEIEKSVEGVLLNIRYGRWFEADPVFKDINVARKAIMQQFINAFDYHIDELREEWSRIYDADMLTRDLSGFESGYCKALESFISSLEYTRQELTQEA